MPAPSPVPLGPPPFIAGAVAFGVVAALLGSGVALCRWAVARQARGRLFASVGTTPAAPVGIVLGAGVQADGQPSLTLSHRLEAALHLFRAGTVERLIVSGNPEARAHDEPAAMRRWLLAHGVPAGAVTEDRGGFRTLATMTRARQVFGVERAVICTQAFHLPRSVFLARGAGIDAVGLAADSCASQSLGNSLRESVATVRAVADVYLFGRGRGLPR